MILYPNAKINIGLNIIRRRVDGFHELETLFVPYKGLTDVLEIVPAEQFSINLYGISLDGNPEDNLCCRAYRLLKEAYDIPPVGIYLYKNIPAGAGLGGGSSDCASTLVALNELFRLGIDQDKLALYASQLGSDVPFFIFNRPMMAFGRGEILEPYTLNLEDYELKLVTPDVFVSTREAYAGCRPHIPEDKLENLLNLPVGQWKGRVVNDFEETVFSLHPSLSDVKAQLYEQGAVYASMSGSGSAMFGIFKKQR